MKVLTLVRHAKSSWDYPELSDFERPLNDRGRKDATRLAARIAAAGPIPDRLVSSPALRAITTAHAFALAFELPREAIVLNPHIYEASLQTLLHVVRSLERKDSEVMLFGHNPGLTRLARSLASCPFDELPTCGVARIELDVKIWCDVAPHCGKLARYECPKTGAVKLSA